MATPGRRRPRPHTGARSGAHPVLACGICGSDLHMLVHGAERRRLSDEMNEGRPPDPMAPISFEPHADTVMGHEFCCEVIDLGEGCSTLQVGDVVVGMPVAFDERGVHALGYSNLYNGGYAEQMVLSELLAIKVPNGLSAAHGCAHRAARRGRARRCQEPHHRRRGRRWCWVSDRSAWRASPSCACAASGRSSPPTSRRSVGSSPSSWVPMWSSTRGSRRPSRHGGRSTACARS